ncbi:benzylsuccinate synthase activating enzyme [Lachnospiraceae bacterium]|nr:benzylsuccinate synthase activating enzyme [Lachnospiraceae bacterium]GFI47767.1 benzylsuccinate synthase activating enzyme [Lachnospiraceae bacterium]
MYNGNQRILITNIQRMCFQDGPGIRTTVFFKGCSIRCPWCANPECQESGIEVYSKDVFGGQEIRKQYGYYINLSDLYNEVVKDHIYYNLSGGGITFSGGEPLLFLSDCQWILEKLHSAKIHCAVETALFVDYALLETVADDIDLFIVDIKTVSKEFGYKVLKGDINQYIENFTFLAEKNKKMLIRFPAIPGYTANEKNILEICEFLKKHNKNAIQVLKGHNFAVNKYKNLRRISMEFDECDIVNIIKLFSDNKIKCQVFSY